MGERLEMLQPRGGQTGGPEMEGRGSFRGEREPQKLGRPDDQKEDKRGGDEKLDQAESVLFHLSFPGLLQLPETCHEQGAWAKGENGAFPHSRVNRDLIKSELMRSLSKPKSTHSVLKLCSFLDLTLFSSADIICPAQDKGWSR